MDVNFGRQPFQFDASGIEAAEQRQLATALSRWGRALAWKLAPACCTACGPARHAYTRTYPFIRCLGPLHPRSTSVSAGEVHQLVRSYLLHYGYAHSLEAFDEAAGMEAQAATAPPAPAPDAAAAQQQGPAGGAMLLPLRAQLRGLLAAGDPAAAWRLLEQQAGGLLAPGQGGSAFELRFHLCCQQYVELIRRVCPAQPHWQCSG